MFGGLYGPRAPRRIQVEVGAPSERLVAACERNDQLRRRCYDQSMRRFAPFRRSLRNGVVCAIVGLLIAASCSSGTDGPVASSPATSAPEPSPVSTDRYEWRRAVVGAGGFVTGLVISIGEPGATYIRTDVGGAYRWDSGSASWHQLLLDTTVPDAGAHDGDYSVASIAVSASDSDVVYLAVGNDFDPSSAGAELSRTGSILRTSDGGGTWTRSDQRFFISGNQNFRVGTERLAVDPADPDHVLFGSQREGLWSSVDGGMTWTVVSTETVPAGNLGDPNEQQPGVNTVAFSPASDGWTAYAGVAGVGVFVGSSKNDSWTSIKEIDAGSYPAGASLENGRLTIALNTAGDDGNDGSIQSYDPNSNKWSEISLPTSSATWLFAVDPFDDRHIVVTDGAVRTDHLWSSNDGGESWISHTVDIESEQIPWLEQTDLADYMSAGRLVFDPRVRGKLWFAEGMAVWTTQDVDQREVVWTSAALGIDEIVVASVVSPPGGAMVSAAADRQGFLFSDLNAARSKPLLDGRFIGGTSLDYSAGSPANLAWVGAEYNLFNESSRREGGAYSSDGGRTWRQFEGMNSAMFGGEIAVSATNPDVLVWVPTHYDSATAYLDDPVGIYVSQNAGQSWTQQAAPGGTDALHRYLWWFTRRALAADRVTGVFYLMFDDGQFYVSSDDTATAWLEAKFAPPCVESNDCHVYGQVQAEPGSAGHLWASVGAGGLYSTVDAGASEWQKAPGVDEARAFGFGAPLPDSTAQTIFLYGRANGDETFGLYRSSDAGKSWLLLSAAPLGIYNAVTTLTGDQDRPGRVYIGFDGNGFGYGDDPTLRR